MRFAASPGVNARDVIEIPRSGDAELQVEGRRLELRELDRPMWPVAGLTKADVLDYYVRVAPLFLPYVVGRPLRVVRFPDGVHLRGVVESEFPPVAGLASVLELADLAAVEFHVPLGPPAGMLFEIDAGAGRTPDDCRAVALKLRDLLAEDGLVSHVKTSGAFGLHVLVPLNSGADEGRAREYARSAAERVASAQPDLVTADARRTSRAGRVLVDWRPNAPRRTTVAPYSLRAMLPGPGVSAPVSWRDVETGSLERSPRDIFTFVDPWRVVQESVQSLPG